MSTRNSYLAYKRDTSHLIYWMTHLSNVIDASSPASAEKPLNTTGQVKVAELVSMAAKIKGKSESIPSTIYSLFRSVIDARMAFYAMFQQMTGDEADPDTQKSNASHKHFIDTLASAFEALGGKEWMMQKEDERQRSQEAETLEDVVFSNAFSTLSLHSQNDDRDNDAVGSDEENDSSQRPSNLSKRQTKSSARGRKNKKGKAKGRARGEASSEVDQQILDEIPLESYRIIADDEGIVTEYLVVVYAFFREWISLRSYVQCLWRDVAYVGINGATAATLSNMAIATIKRTTADVFVDFPGHDAFETMVSTITRGKLEKFRFNFELSLIRYANSAPLETYKEVTKTYLDLEEQCSIYAYNDLLAFIADFQMNRTGKPTKRMLKELNDWNPRFDLQAASNEERIKWRRSYTINWLYDLVNVYSSIVVQRNTMKGEHHVYEDVDWSPTGPWAQHVRLFGINEFAGAVTTLAMQKPNTDVRKRIMPDLVFQLQCIVDSLCVSRGWSVSALHGHTLKYPPKNFRPRRDIDLFLDRENERRGHGYCESVDILIACLERDAELSGQPDRYRQSCEIMKVMQEDFVNWLGESKYQNGLTTIPPSRFSNTNSNGLWEYSPYLCGAGLMEGLELAWRLQMVLVWDRIPEPMCLLHLHNMLVKKGYISQPVGLYASLADISPETWFLNEEAPTSYFDQAFVARLKHGVGRDSTAQRQIAQQKIRTASDMHGILDLAANTMIRMKSNLLLYREAEWNAEKIPDEDLKVISMLGQVRLSQTKRVVDPDTGELRLERTKLAGRAQAEMRLDDRGLLRHASRLYELTSRAGNEDIRKAIAAADLARRPGFKEGPEPMRRKGKRSDVYDPTGTELFSLLKVDIHRDVSGSLPLSGVNYQFVTLRFILLFMQIEKALKEASNPLWREVYQTVGGSTEKKRVGLTTLVLHGEDKEAMRIIAAEFENPRAGFLNHVYWEDVDEKDELLKKCDKQDGEMPDCTIM